MEIVSDIWIGCISVYKKFYYAWDNNIHGALRDVSTYKIAEQGLTYQEAARGAYYIVILYDLAHSGQKSIHGFYTSDVVH